MQLSSRNLLSGDSPYGAAASGEPENAGRANDPPGSAQFEPGDLPYRVELWDEARMSVEQVLAVTANGSIGYAAFYAATREFPDRYISLRHKDSIISRWNGPGH